MKTLDQVRKQHETSLHPMLVITKNKTVYVVLWHPRSADAYSLHRYFMVDEEWDVSVDKSRVGLQTCLDAVNKAFKEFYPRAGEST